MSRGMSMSVIVLIEVSAASMLVPSAKETEEIANKLAAAEAAKSFQTEDAPEQETASDSLASAEMREVTLGNFHVVSYDHDTGSSLNIDFELYATVLEDEESEFFDLFEANRSRIREQVFITVRGTDITDLTDPTLGLIKRKILEKTNRALGKPLLHEAIFSTFSFVER